MPTPPGPHAERSASLHCLGFYLAVSATLLAFIPLVCGHHFLYTVDDAYIHLELARNITHGTYGYNPGEFSTPASSILWPFLMLPFGGTTFQQYLPLILNLIFGACTAWLLGLFVNRWPWEREGRNADWKRDLTCILAVFVCNLAGLTFLGMEHVLQLLLAVACAYGILEAFDDRPIPTWCIACAVVGPIVRYESLALTVAVAIALFAQKRPRAAVLAIAASLVVPLIFSVFLISHGAHALPNSVLVKIRPDNAIPGNGSIYFAHILSRNVLTSLRDFRFPLLVILSIALLWKSNGRRRVILAGVFAALLLQMLFGRIGWQHRYEVYGIAFVALVLFGAGARTGARWSYAALFLFACGWIYFAAAAEVPAASREIYQQHYQVARFLGSYYRGNFAINDAGLTAYHRARGAYVLDLMGLASTEALDKSPLTAGSIADLAHRHHVGVAALYPDWFEVPITWHEVADLHLPNIARTAGGNTVGIFVTPDGDESAVRLELEEFRKTLPPGVTLTTNR